MNNPDGIASGLRWSFVSQAFRVGCQVIGLIIFARYLSAEDFGLVSMATLVSGIAFFFRDFGTVAAVIQKPKLNDDLLSSIFWFNLLVGFTVAIIIVFIAPIIAGLFDEPRLTFVLWAIAGAFPIGATGLVHQAILEREKKFKPVAIVEVASVLLGLICGVLAANYGVGAYSLVAQSIVTALVTSMGMWRISIWRPKIGVSIAELRSILGFSSNLLGFNFINYFARNADGFLIGRLLGANDLGVYTIAYNRKSVV